MRSFRLLSSFIVLFCSVSCSLGGVFHAPVHIDESRNHESMLQDAKIRKWPHPPRNTRRASLHRRTQEVIKPTLPPSSSSHNVELWDGPFPVSFVTAAALGNPPQPFRLLIDTAFDTLIVPSVEYVGASDYALELFYQKNLSSTYRSGGTELTQVYELVRFSGELAIDEFQIAGLSILNQPFINAERGNTLGFIDFYFGYEGVLGLAPRWNTSIDSTLTPSPWSLMLNQTVLDRNLFTLELPSRPQNILEPRTGSIGFGGISQKYHNANFQKLPLSNYSDEAWIVEAQSLTLTNKTHQIEHVFTNRTVALFDPVAWYLGLPWTLVKQIRESIPHECGFVWCFVDCDDRKNLPDLVFQLGWHNFTLTAYDYAPELFAPDGPSMCSFEVFQTDGVAPIDGLVLGKQFLSKYYSVFNLDAGEVWFSPALDKQSHG